MTEELKESGIVTALSVVGLVFGMIGMFGSFIPCIGALAFFIGIPAALVSGIALWIAYVQKAKSTFAIVALTISLIGVVISGWQYFSITSAGELAKREIDKMYQRKETAKAVITERKPSKPKAVTPKRKITVAPSISLTEAKQRIPGILKEIYQDLDQGNPRAASSFITSEILSNSSMIDTICKPFTYRAHYIESIIERPNNRFEARIRVLFQPMEESAQTLSFRVQGHSLIVENISTYLGDGFRTWENAAMEVARKFYYALKANRQDVLNKLVSSPEVLLSLTNNNLQRYLKSLGEIISVPVWSHPTVGIKLYKGLKAYVELPCKSRGTFPDKLKFYIDKIKGEYKIVKWEFHPGNLSGQSWDCEDPNIESYTLKRFESGTK